MFMWWYGQLLHKEFFCNILRTFCRNDFKSRKIDFHKQRMQPEKYQNLGIASLSPNTGNMN